MKATIRTTAKRVGDEIFEGEVDIEIREPSGMFPRRFTWKVVNQVPNRDGSLSVTTENGLDFISFGGNISNKSVETFTPARQVFFHLVGLEIDLAIKLLTPVPEPMAVVQMAGSSPDDMVVAAIKERPTGKVGDGGSRIVYPEFSGENAELFLKAIA